MNVLEQRLAKSLDDLRASGTYKTLRRVTAAMDAVTQIDNVGEVFVFCSNNYLGLANHPNVIAAAADGLQRYGAGTASVRFICGTFKCHFELEEQLADFLGTEASLTYSSCWNANEGLLPALTLAGDAIVSDSSNHASIIDAARLSPATRKIYAHADMHSLSAELDTVSAAEVKLVVSDGVFSMEGEVARLPDIVRISRQHNGVVVIDDSHGTGVLGVNGRGTHEHFGLPSHGPVGIDIITSTLGKALGGGNGGFVAGSKELIDYLVQRSRPHLFSNALAPPTACAALEALQILRREPERVTRLHDNVDKMRSGLRSLGFNVVDSPSGIIPIMIGDTAAAIRLSERLLERGIFVVGFGYPVVPEGKARLRVQMSSVHTDRQIEQTLNAFAELNN